MRAGRVGGKAGDGYGQGGRGERDRHSKYC